MNYFEFYMDKAKEVNAKKKQEVINEAKSKEPKKEPKKPKK